MREADGTLAAIGLVGLVMLAMFVIKNLTDDFMIRPTSKEFWALERRLHRLRIGGLPHCGRLSPVVVLSRRPRTQQATGFASSRGR
jgi:hypothetical protein